MTQFQNKTGHVVFIDMGGFISVKPGETIELEGALTAPPLTPVFGTPRRATPKKAPKKAVKTPPKKAVKSRENVDPSGTI